MTGDAINPGHYKDHPVFGDLECVDVTSRLGFLRGNAIKYLWRLGRKDDASQDAYKALWYIDRLAESYPSPGSPTGVHHIHTTTVKDNDVLRRLTPTHQIDLVQWAVIGTDNNESLDEAAALLIHHLATNGKQSGAREAALFMRLIMTKYKLW